MNTLVTPANITQRQLNTVLPVDWRIFSCLRDKTDLDELYKVLTSDVPIRDKRDYVYRLPITLTRKHIIWSAYNGY